MERPAKLLCQEHRATGEMSIVCFVYFITFPGVLIFFKGPITPSIFSPLKHHSAVFVDDYILNVYTTPGDIIKLLVFCYASLLLSIHIHTRIPFGRRLIFFWINKWF